MEFHLVVGFPCLEGVEVCLEGGLVVFGVDLSIEEAVVCKESDAGAWGEVGVDVVDVYEEEEGAEDSPLRNP